MHAVELSGAERDAKYADQADRYPQYAEYQRMITRTIPVVAPHSQACHVVKTWPEHNGDVYNTMLPVSAIEKLTGAGDFDAPPDRAAVDAVGRGSNHNKATPSGFAVEILPFKPKHVVLEVFGPPGTLATINYHR